MVDKNPREATSRASVLEAITTPLGFFSLALLIIEAFLAFVVVGGDLSTPLQATAIGAGICLFLLVSVLVFILVWFHPEYLTFDRDAHLQRRRGSSAVHSEHSLNEEISILVEPGSTSDKDMQEFLAAVTHLNRLIDTDGFRLVVRKDSQTDKGSQSSPLPAGVSDGR